MMSSRSIAMLRGVCVPVWKLICPLSILLLFYIPLVVEAAIQSRS